MAKLFGAWVLLRIDRKKRQEVAAAKEVLQQAVEEAKASQNVDSLTAALAVAEQVGVRGVVLQQARKTEQTVLEAQSAAIDMSKSRKWALHREDSFVHDAEKNSDANHKLPRLASEGKAVAAAVSAARALRAIAAARVSPALGEAKAVEMIALKHRQRRSLQARRPPGGNNAIDYVEAPTRTRLLPTLPAELRRAGMERAAASLGATTVDTHAFNAPNMKL